MLVASRDLVATVHLCPRRAPRAPRGSLCSAAESGAGSTRDGCSRSRLLLQPRAGNCRWSQLWYRNTRVSSEERPRSVSSRGCEERGGER